MEPDRLPGLRLEPLVELRAGEVDPREVQARVEVRRVAGRVPRRARGQLAPLDQDRVGPPGAREVVEDARAEDAAADDGDAGRLGHGSASSGGSLSAGSGGSAGGASQGAETRVSSHETDSVRRSCAPVLMRHRVLALHHPPRGVQDAWLLRVRIRAHPDPGEELLLVGRWPLDQWVVEGYRYSAVPTLNLVGGRARRPPQDKKPVRRPSVDVTRPRPLSPVAAASGPTPLPGGALARWLSSRSEPQVSGARALTQPDRVDRSNGPGELVSATAAGVGMAEHATPAHRAEPEPAGPVPTAATAAATATRCPATRATPRSRPEAGPDRSSGPRAARRHAPASPRGARRGSRGDPAARTRHGGGARPVTGFRTAGDGQRRVAEADHHDVAARDRRPCRAGTPSRRSSRSSPAPQLRSGGSGGPGPRPAPGRHRPRERASSSPPAGGPGHLPTPVRSSRTSVRERPARHPVVDAGELHVSGPPGSGPSRGRGRRRCAPPRARGTGPRRAAARGTGRGSSRRARSRGPGRTRAPPPPTPARTSALTPSNTRRNALGG